MKKTIAVLILSLPVALFITNANTQERHRDGVSVPSDYEKLTFYAEFFSEYPSYPHRGNRQRGKVHVYSHDKKRRIRKPLNQVPRHIRQTLFSRGTTNPFRKLYPDLYRGESVSKLNNCPMLGTKFDIDNNPATQEWLVTTSTELCLYRSARGSDSQPHFWILQQHPNERPRVLAEGDRKVQIRRTSSERYPEIAAEFNLKNSHPHDKLQCGGALLKWNYSQGRYHPRPGAYHTGGCDRRYYPNTQGKHYEAQRQKHLSMVKPKIEQRLSRVR